MLIRETMITFKIKLYKGKKYKDGKHPIVLELTNSGKVHRITVGYNAKVKEFNEKRGIFKKSVDNHQIKNENLQDTLLLASRIIDDFRRRRKPFSIDIFKSKFKKNNSATSVYDFFDELKAELRLKGI